MEIGEKFLPVGTVCLLQNGKKKVMITGFCVNSPDVENKVFDYIGCLYPEGVISSDQNLIFNHDQIAQVFFKGYVNEEETEFKNKLKEFLATGQIPVSESTNSASTDVEVLEENAQEGTSSETINN